MGVDEHGDNIAVIRKWFDSLGLDLQFREERGAFVVDLIGQDSGLVIRSYGKGTSPSTAAERAKERYVQEQ